MLFYQFYGILFPVMRDMNKVSKVIRKATCSICDCEVEVKRDTWTEDLMCDRCTWFWYKGYKGKPQSDNSAALVEVAKKTKQGLLKSH